MATITSGRVAYRRTVQPEPYESKTAEVEFAFVVEDNDDPAAATADILRSARQEVHQVLGLTPRRGERSK